MNDKRNFPITLFSFGYKYKPPQDVNFLFDVRFLSNPFHDTKLRSFTGLTEEVADFVLDNTSGKECLQHLEVIIRFQAKELQSSGKEELRVGIGCTGGHHRSVAVVETLARLLKKDFSAVEYHHRDISRESH